MSRLSAKSDDQLRQELQLLKRQECVLAARDGMLAFGRFMMPDTEDPDDSDLTEYQESAPARCLCELVEDFESGRKKRIAISIAPQTGKTMNVSIHGAAWILGRNPRARIVISTYSAGRAQELGKDLLNLLRSPQYQQVFPDAILDPKIQNQLYMQTIKGGRIMLAGAGGPITGKTADYFIIDDPIKGEEDESDLTPTALDRLWKWFFRIAYSRGSTKTSILVVHTRWVEDDLIGRLCDPTHPERNKRFKGIADKWYYLNLPAIVKDRNLAEILGLELIAPTEPDVIDMFGTEPLSSIWPENKSPAYYAEWKRGDPRSFASLAMGTPAPDDGAYFVKAHIMEYDNPNMVPANLRKYAASDHAVSAKQGRDFTVMGVVGIDEFDNIWVLPDLIRDRIETDVTVSEIVAMIKRHNPLMWWMESELISKSFGPFLFTRMRETNAYCTIVPVRPAADKKTRARAIQGRMSMQKVYFPSFAPWWQEAKNELLRFPFATNDDFVDFLSLIGMGLTQEVAADTDVTEQSDGLVTGSIEWILASTRRRAETKAVETAKAGW